MTIQSNHGAPGKSAGIPARQNRDLGYFDIPENLRFRFPRKLGGPSEGDGEWRNRVAVVTGASSGIGRECALRLAGAGAQVVLAARSAERLEAVAEDCHALGGETITVVTDVANEGQCRKLIAAAVKRFGKLDLLVNNAGIDMDTPLEDLPDLGLFKRVMDVNFYGQVYCAYYALPYLKETEGRILGMSSLGGKISIPGNTSYSASKFGLHGFYDSLRMEVRGSGVSVTVVCPYWVVTEFHQRQMDNRGKMRGPVGSAITTPRMMTAGRCAEIALSAARKRKREVLMPPGPLAMWLGMIASGLLDRLIIRFFLEPASRRIEAAKGV